MLSAEERERYARHILLKEIGGPGQQLLKAARVAIVGAGGLGAPAALYLAAAGVGHLRLIDDDVVSLSNLQRQIVFESDDAGAPKVQRAATALKKLNPHVEIDARRERLTNANARELLAGVDLVLDGTDDFATRFAVNSACHALAVTLISGAVGRWDGQVATFKSGPTKHLPESQRLPCYRCFVPETPPNAETCAQVGVVGALAGVIGSMMALEAIKEIADAGESLAGRILLFDGLGANARRVALPRDPACVVCGHG
ncbi:HesA/MoeB/ThiF family protein [Vitreimonas flagellata]|uniref:HesA/MoeB/ThiF family protein n=1 Tax=Vitreimonas flagellata TaxID=2560861 RepID=UPI0010750A49|nr:molybdopterin-synthase adenylyltransferase MoeB [Vitreimonas flagellata]